MNERAQQGRARIQELARQTIREHGLVLVHELKKGDRFDGGNLVALLEIFAGVLTSQPDPDKVRSLMQLADTYGCCVSNVHIKGTRSSVDEKEDARSALESALREALASQPAAGASAGPKPWPNPCPICFATPPCQHSNPTVGTFVPRPPPAAPVPGEPSTYFDLSFVEAKKRILAMTEDDAKGFAISMMIIAAKVATPVPPGATEPPKACPLGCEIACKAEEHGCPSECPFLPNRPAAPSTVSAGGAVPGGQKP